MRASANILLCMLFIYGSTVYVWISQHSLQRSAPGPCEASPSEHLENRSGYFFVLSVWHYSEFCGGCGVLHLLAHELNRLYGQPHPIAYIVPDINLNATIDQLIVNPGYSTPKLPPWLNTSEAVAIYAETTSGNPIGARYVVRYLLWFPALFGGPPATQYTADEMIICWSKGYCQEFENRLKYFQVRIVAYHFDSFLFLPKFEKRNGTITFVKKKTWATKSGGVINISPDQLIPGQVMRRETPKRERLEAFSRAEMFVSYDPGTFLNVEAAVAGCLSIVIPLPNVTREEWLASVGEEFRYGIAYGMEEIGYARESLPKVLPHLYALAQKQDMEIHNFIGALEKFYTSLLL